MRKQYGATLMAMLAVLIMGAAWFTVTAISNPIDRTAQERMHNAAILQEAKTALVGYVAHHAAMAAENDPGALPCPEAAGNIGTALEGIAAGNCTLPAVGRLPWRTLGLDKWRDAAGEPLWYVVSAGWSKPNAATNTVINSNSTGQLTLDGTGDVVALIIAPGRPLQVSASPSCVARVQRRTTPSPAIDLRDYLECDNATMPADAIFASTGATGSFNDQVLPVTGAEALPAIEAAVAHRFERDVAPLLAAVYSGGSWPADPLLPFPAPFSNPAASNWKGTVVASQGLLPFTYSTNPADGTACDPTPPAPAPADPRCDPSFIAWNTGAAPSLTSSMLVGGSTTCNATTTLVTCSFRATYWSWLPASAGVTVTHRVDNLGRALRQFDLAAPVGGLDPGWTVSGGSMSADGSALVSVSGTTVVASGGNLISGLLEGLLCGLGGLLGGLLDCATHSVTIPIALFADHPLVRDDAAQNPQHWFLRNRWHQVAYYAVAPAVTPAGAAPRNCFNGVNCLTVTFDDVAPSNNHRALIVLTGRQLATQNRPAPPGAHTVRDYMEGANCDLVGANCAPNTTFTVRTPTLVINRTFNDRIAVIDSN